MTILTDDELKAVRERDARDFVSTKQYVAESWPVECRADRRALLRHIDALEKDAARYRWLRDVSCNSLHVTKNDHACNYVSAKEWIEDNSHGHEWHKDDDPAEIERMKDTNTIWTLQIYPDTPIGFNYWNAATLDAAIDAAKEREETP